MGIMIQRRYGRCGRPMLPRRVRQMPAVDYFKPRGIPLNQLSVNILTLEEAEAIRLKDLDKKEQEDCAKKMGVSRRTFARVLKDARQKIADAMFNGKAIEISGGNYQTYGGLSKMQIGRAQGQGAGRGMRAGQGAGGRGRMGGIAAGPGGGCICPKCGYNAIHQIGVPCNQMNCPKCGAKMTRGTESAVRK